MRTGPVILVLALSRVAHLQLLGAFDAQCLCALNLQTKNPGCFKSRTQ